MQCPQGETVTLNDILITEELSRRSPRPPNLQAENQALHSLARQLVNQSETMLQSMVDIALDLCNAGTAGVSLLETTPNGEEIFRWNVLAGTWEQYVGGTTPRNFSPCGVCLERGTPVLFSHPDRYFTYFQAANTPIVEGLVLPLIANNHALGSIWIMSHDEERHFDAEDVRVMTSLADFTAAALLLKQRQTGELLASNAALEAEIAEHKQTEEQLGEVQRRLELSLTGAGLGVWTYRVGTNEFWADDRAQALHGHEPNEVHTFEAAGANIHPEDRDRAQAALAQVVQNRSKRQMEYRVICKDGSVRWIASYADFVPMSERDEGMFYGVVQDITERKRIEDECQQAEAAIAADLKNTQLLHELSTRLVTEGNIQALYQEIMAAAIALTRADAGTVQILDEATQDLLLLATQGFERDLTDHFYRVNASSNTSCGRALVTGDRTFIDFDVPQSEDPDGSMRIHVEAGYLSAQSTPLIARSGKAIGMVSTHWRNHHRPSERELRFLDLLARQAADLIEQRQVANALRESDAKYRSLFESIDEGFCIFEMIYDENGRAVDYRFVEVNPVFERQTGLKNVVGKLGSEIAPNTERYWLETYDDVLKTGNPKRIENYNQATDRWYSAYASRIGNEGSRQVCTVFSDITERKRNEQRQAFLLQLSDTLRSLSDAVEIQTTVTRITMNFFGADRCYYCEIIDGSAIIRRDASQADLPSVVGAYPLENSPIFRTMLDAGQPFVFQDVHTTNLLDGNLRQACLQLQIIAGLMVPVIKQGESVGILVITQTTPRNWTEFEMDLVEEIADRTWATIERTRVEAHLREAELQRVREQSVREQEQQRAESLAELDRTKTQFFSNISHEFRTPLTLLLAPLQDALSDCTYPLAPSQRERLELVHRNAIRLLKLVNTLLDFSRIEAGRMEAVYEPTDLAMFTTELASVFRSAIERAGLQLIVDYPPLPEPVYVDRQMWEKIVLNLLSNAFKFTLEGEIAVRLHPTDDHHVMLQVQDTGTGIPPEELPHVFERFYQVRRTKARTHEGSGIGLALVHELIRLHGGTVDVSSTVGQGSCFTITLPLGTAHLQSDRLHRVVGNRITATRTLASTAIGAAPYVEEAERWVPERAEGRGQKAEAGTDLLPSASRLLPSDARVLLVDDNADMREYLTRILSDHVQVEAVADGASALVAAQERVPDLVLTDVMMPGLDGFELLKALRADPRTREIPIILLSARAGEESVVEGLEAGADDYLIKPFSAQELISRVNGHLQMAQLRLEALHQERTMNRRKDELLSTVSHELNTPLVAILGWTRLLRANPPSQSVLVKALETIERNATLQAKLISDLLDMSRITAGKLRLKLEPVELGSVIENAIAAVLTAAIAKDIHLHWSIGHRASDEPTHQEIAEVFVVGDRDRLQQIITNLLTNAIKFTPNQGSINVELSVIERHNSSHTSIAQISITDTGIGISAEFLPHVFDRFRQAQESSSSKGLGLGLAIARHLVELHGGTIHVSSNGVGQGATFIVNLPLKPVKS